MIIPDAPPKNEAELGSYLSYDPKTGVFTWLKRISIRITVGAQAGAVASHGYRNIRVGGKTYYAHRLAWYFSTGHWPSQQIDHINGIRDDNRIENLREASSAENTRNSKRPSTNTSGFKGVSWNKRDRNWEASIQHQGTHIKLGRYSGAEDAALAYQRKASELFGDFARRSA